MKKLFAICLLTLALPVSSAEESTVNSEDAFSICMRATARFEEIEKEKAKNEAVVSSFSESCKSELKPAAYWECMDKEAMQKTDFNTAHFRCMKKSNISN